MASRPMQLPQTVLDGLQGRQQQRMPMLAGFEAVADPAPELVKVLAKLHTLAGAAQDAVFANEGWASGTLQKNVNGIINGRPNAYGGNEPSSIPKLQRTMLAASGDWYLAQKWLVEAQNLVSELSTNQAEAEYQDLMAGADQAVVDAVAQVAQWGADRGRQVVKAVIGAGNKAVELAWWAAIEPLVKSPLFWVVALGAGAVFVWPVVAPFIAVKATRKATDWALQGE